MGDSRASRSIRRRRGDTASRSPPAGSPPAARDCGGPGAREFAAAVRAPVVGEAPSPASTKDSDAVVTSNASGNEFRSVGWLATPSEGGRPRNRDDLGGLRDTERTDRRFLIPGHPHLGGPSSRGAARVVPAARRRGRPWLRGSRRVVRLSGSPPPPPDGSVRCSRRDGVAASWNVERFPRRSGGA